MQYTSRLLTILKFKSDQDHLLAIQDDFEVLETNFVHFHLSFF